jgi:hypothetical protein
MLSLHPPIHMPSEDDRTSSSCQLKCTKKSVCGEGTHKSEASVKTGRGRCGRSRTHMSPQGKAIFKTCTVTACKEFIATA